MGLKNEASAFEFRVTTAKSIQIIRNSTAVEAP